VEGADSKLGLAYPELADRPVVRSWSPWAMMGAMTVIRINAITVPESGGEELARRFAERAGAVDNAEGFEGFELLRPTDDRLTWLVVTRWRDKEMFDAWVASPAFAHGHRGASGEAANRPHVGTHSELWSYDVEISVPPPSS
jgi:heme-degrading monooxygenase HmoA